jgi:putative thioredoxin
MKTEMENFDFEKDVLARSFERPIVVDYWSPTCGPCLFLGPVLEKLAGKAEGNWELVKINTNEHNRLAYEHGISSIPHVKMFSKGQVVSEFVGALPEGTLVKWLDEFIPTEAKEELNAIRARIDGPDRGAALADLRIFANNHPELPMAALILASETVFDDPEGAKELLATFKLGDLFWEAAENVRTIADIGLFDDSSDNGAANQLRIAREALKAQDFDAAVAALVDAVTADQKYAKELPRRGTIALLRLFGPQHPITLKYRRKFEMALS